MSDYIRRQDAIDAFNRIKNILKKPETAHYDTLMFYEIEDVLEDVEPADVVQVVHGRWIKYTGMGKVQWMCSECSAEEKNPKVANYCYHCGAKMDGEE